MRTRLQVREYRAAEVRGNCPMARCPRTERLGVWIAKRAEP